MLLKNYYCPRISLHLQKLSDLVIKILTYCISLVKFMKMVDLIKNFIRSMRTGNFQLYMESLKRMLPFFPAAGHNSYMQKAYTFISNN